MNAIIEELNTIRNSLVLAEVSGDFLEDLTLVLSHCEYVVKAGFLIKPKDVLNRLDGDEKKDTSSRPLLTR